MAMISAITHPNPPVVDGKTYDKLSVSLVLSTDAPDSAKMFLRMVVTLTPYRMEQDRDEDGQFAEGEHVELLADAQQVFVYADSAAAAQSNPTLARFLMAMAQGGQQFVNEVL